ncbi:MAG: hypothetical protein IT326_04665, partial [Anaerolineae bacterium]|nr:hypothetical protein [Anaerolineae bacterium]
MAGRGTDILLGGNPEGLATRYVAERCFPMRALREVVGSVVRGELESARHRAESDPTLGAAVVEWVSREYDDLVRKASVEDIPTAVINDLRAEPLYSDIPFEKLAQLVRQIDLTTIDYRRLDRARRYAEEHGLSTSLIPEVQYRLSDYRMLGGVMGQNEQIETLTRRLYELHYNARAALVRAVLAGQEDRAREIASQLPALPEALIQDVHNIVAEHEAERHRVWELGGLHVIGTERHESRRIDDQLRGRAARQGDPGSSRFYLSLEDELMMRFGGERTKRIMDRLNIPEDMPISANILSNIIEQAQARFESYYFDIRKNLVEYDEAVNRQRAIVYDERDAILRGDSSRLDEFVRRFIQEALDRLCERYIEGYEAWAMADVTAALDDYSDFESGEVNTRGVVQRVMPLFPRLDQDALQALLSITNGDELTRELNTLITDGIEQGHNLRMLHADIARIVPLWPVAPPFGPRGIENWERFVEEVQKTLALYTRPLAEEDRERIMNVLSEDLDRLFLQQVASISKGDQVATVQSSFYANLGAELNRVFLETIDGMEQDDLIEVLLERVEYLLEIASLGPVELQAGVSDRAVWQPDGQVFAIGEEELGNYQRALMLTVMDEEWRQYLNA